MITNHSLPSFNGRSDIAVLRPVPRHACCVCAPKAKIAIEVRELLESDVPRLFDIAQSGLSPTDRYDLSVRLEHYQKKIGTCYVAITPEGEPCYFQWLIGPENNKEMDEFFQGRFPRLKSDEVLLENAFTLPGYRGLGIMPCAMAKIAELAAERTARWVVTFVAVDNIASLKGCERAGFHPYLLRSDKHFVHRRFRMLKFAPIGDFLVNGQIPPIPSA